MAILKRSTMAVFSNENCIYDHRVRFALAEKAVNVEVFYVKENDQTLLELNPEGLRPTLVDRDLTLMHSNIILEYLDERFPHPPLLPVYPILRAKVRLMINQIEKDWYTPMLAIEKKIAIEKNRKDLTDCLLKLLPIFTKNKYFMGEDFGMIDCCIAPLIWRLPALGIELPENAQAIIDYSERIFERTGFQASLSNHEFKIRNDDEF